MVTTILRLPDVTRERGRKRSTHYLDIKNGLFTRPISIGARAVGWPAHEVEAVNAARIAGDSDDEIRALVVKLEAARKAPQANAEQNDPNIRALIQRTSKERAV
jgi:prophage regulatory protein